ncbi:probable serine/threonine-protein kinase pats1 [Ostrea edulis]|uniref:probable serine/threonine-protein kinase pats1 n=1 Tax=Ostrea edulis TaxID=37623 RepID=UPI0024AFD71A|nr:probable serine/threonine-protein kinase pats1 [Ostrea edulis]
MIVGCVGAGKSTLLKRLQKRSLDELKQIQSTVGLEVHEDIFEIAPESDCLKDLPVDTDKEGKQLLSILDFGGQCAYYACHQVYLSRRALYLLVINMSKRFDEKVDPLLCEQEGTMFTDWSYGEYMLFWLKSVHTYCDNDAPVIIVGTHLDQAVGQNSNILFNSILDYLQFDKHLKTHLDRNRCFVLGFKSDGSPFQDTLTNLEKCMVSIAKQDRWKETIPTDWALSEVVLRELRGQRKRMASVTELSIRCFGGNEEKYTQIRDILKFYHDIGVILHFDEGSLAETVIIDIQWFVDSFKNIITDPNHIRDNIDNHSDWRDFNENGHIQDILLTKLWGSQKFEINLRDKNDLLHYMERLGLIFIGPQAHYIPCMNKRSFATQQQNDLQSIQNKTSVMVFRFPFLPYFIYFRLIVACLTSREWRFPRDERLSLYKNLACFVYKNHTVALAVNEYSIQLQVFQRQKDPISKTVTLEIRDDIERLLNDLTCNFHKKITYTVGFQCSKQEVFREHDDCFVEETKIHGKGKQTCPIHEAENHHILRKSNLLYYWNKDVRDGPTNLSVVLSESDLLKFNKMIGSDMELIATCLGLSEVEMDRLKMENPTSMSNVVQKILLTWKRKRGPTATLENLEKSLQDAERDTTASVDWSVINRAKEDILKERNELMQ